MGTTVNYSLPYPAMSDPPNGPGAFQSLAETTDTVLLSKADTSALTAKAPLASPTFTGTLTTPRIITPPVALTDAATIVVDASLGNHFRVTLGGNRTLGAPSNPTDGQKMLIEAIQDGTGSRTLAYNAVYVFGSDIASPTLTTTASKRDFIGFVYNSAVTAWHCIAVVKGY